MMKAGHEIYGGQIVVLEVDEKGLATLLDFPNHKLPEIPCGTPLEQAEIEALFPHLAAHGTVSGAISPLET